MSSSNASEPKRTHLTSDISPTYVGTRVSLAGWVEDVRPLGSIIFMTVRDARGLAQVVFSKNQIPRQVFQEAARTPRQSSVFVEGVVKPSRAKSLSVEVSGDRLVVVSPAVHPLPLDPAGRVAASLDVRLDAQPLDLRRPIRAAVFKIRHWTLQMIRKTFIAEGFMEVNTSKLIGEAAEGGANLFCLDYFGRHAYLAQSPQLYKEQLTLSLDRVFEIANYFRAEKSHTSRHLSEFLSVDVEAAFCDEWDVMTLAEKMIVSVYEGVKKECVKELSILGRRLTSPKTPFRRVTYSKLIQELKDQGVQIEEGDDLSDAMLRRVGRMQKGYFWITEWPTKLKPFYIATSPKNKAFSRSFDLQYGYLELASGGRRVSDGDELKQRIHELGLDSEDFSSHLESFSWGMPPHAGWGLGFDRLVMILVGVRNIRECVLYPRDRFRLTP